MRSVVPVRPESHVASEPRQIQKMPIIVRRPVGFQPLSILEITLRGIKVDKTLSFGSSPRNVATEAMHLT